MAGWCTLAQDVAQPHVQRLYSTPCRCAILSPQIETPETL